MPDGNLVCAASRYWILSDGDWLGFANLGSKMKRSLLITFLAFAVFDSGCLRSWPLARDPDKIVKNALLTVPLLRSFKTQYPESTHFISYLAGKQGHQIWNSKAPLYKRYILSMQIPASITPDSLNVHLEGPPKFYLNEIVSITDLHNEGQMEIRYGESFSFDAAQWNKLLAANGDFDAIGIQLKKDHPVNGFGDYSGY